MSVVLMNLGPDWRRSDGVVIKRGEQFTASAQDLDTMQRRKQIGTRFMVVADAPAPKQPTAGPGPAKAQERVVRQPTPQKAKERAPRQEDRAKKRARVDLT